jgi:hypothetical protein
MSSIMASNDWRVHKIDLAKYPRAQCLDGSPGGFYAKKSISLSAQNKFIIHHQGGGWCEDTKQCQSRTATHLGSSNLWPDIADAEFLSLSHGLGGFLSSGREINPLFFDWNVLYVQYCDGASYSGNKIDDVPVENSHNVSLHFRGQNIINALYDIFLNEFGLDQGIGDLPLI